MNIEKNALRDFDIELLGPQKITAKEASLGIDKRVIAIQSYAKLLIALEDFISNIDVKQESSEPRLRLVRIIQDVVDLVENQSAYMLRLSTNIHGASTQTLIGVNSCILSIVLGNRLNIIHREALVDIGLAALLHALEPSNPELVIHKILVENNIGTKGLRTAMILSEYPVLSCKTKQPKGTNLYARLLGVTVAYTQLTLGWQQKPLHPLDALAYLHTDPHYRFDRRLVDFLVNTLRAFPVGSHVLLSNGKEAIVDTHGGGCRWDRPIVQIEDNNNRLDLMLRQKGSFAHKIIGTCLFIEANSPLETSLSSQHFIERPQQQNSLEAFKVMPAKTHTDIPISDWLMSNAVTHSCDDELRAEEQHHDDPFLEALQTASKTSMN